MLHLTARDFLHPVQRGCIAQYGPMQTAILGVTDHQRVVGHRLRKLIDALGISYVEAGKDMDVSKSKLGNWMRGDNYPDPHAIYRFCRARRINSGVFDFIFLGDYSGLPQRIAEPLEAELLSSPEASAELAPQTFDTLG